MLAGQGASGGPVATEVEEGVRVRLSPHRKKDKSDADGRSIRFQSAFPIQSAFPSRLQKAFPLPLSLTDVFLSSSIYLLGGGAYGRAP